MYRHVHIHTHTHTHTHTHAHTHAHTHTHMHTHTHTHTRTHTHACTHTHARTHTYQSHHIKTYKTSTFNELAKNCLSKSLCLFKGGTVEGIGGLEVESTATATIGLVFATNFFLVLVTVVAGLIFTEVVMTTLSVADCSDAMLSV